MKKNSDLFYILGSKLSWSNEKKAEYIQNLGLNIALQFEIFIEDINNQINNYLQSYARIRFC